MHHDFLYQNHFNLVIIKIHIRVESGSGDLDNLGHLGHLFGRSSRSHSQTKLSGCDPDITCSLDNSVGIIMVSEWTLGLMNALKYYWCETSLLAISSCFEVCSVQRFHPASRSLCMGPVLYPAKNEVIYGIVPYQNFSCHVTLLLKRKLQHVGHIQIVLWVSGSNQSTGVIHLQPWSTSCVKWENLYKLFFHKELWQFA